MLTFLQQLKLESLHSHFVEEGIDIDVLMNCKTRNDLEFLGISKRGHIAKLLSAIKEKCNSKTGPNVGPCSSGTMNVDGNHFEEQVVGVSKRFG